MFFMNAGDSVPVEVSKTDSDNTIIYQDTPGFCKSTTLEEVKAQDYKLTPGIYVGTEDEEDDGIPFEEKMRKLKSKLGKQFEKSNELQERIKMNLNGI